MFVIFQSKKEEERIKREELYAESQRLLRGNDDLLISLPCVWELVQIKV